MVSTKSRGRPEGTGIDDSAALDAVADELAVRPSMPPMTAMGIVAQRLCLRPCQESATRRLKRKWDKGENSRLAAAQQRRSAQQALGAALFVANVFEKYNRVMQSPEMMALTRRHAILTQSFRLWEQSPEMRALTQKMEMAAKIAKQWELSSPFAKSIMQASRATATASQS